MLLDVVLLDELPAVAARAAASAEAVALTTGTALDFALGFCAEALPLTFALQEAAFALAPESTAEAAALPDPQPTARRQGGGGGGGGLYF